MKAIKERTLMRIRVSALIVENNEILAIQHKKNGKEYYLLPGGGVDEGEDFETAMRREMMEELGVKVDVGDLLFIAESISPDKSRHIISVVLECKLINKDFNLGDDERLSGFSFLSVDKLEGEIFYPDFKKVLIDFIKTGQLNRKRFLMEWKD